MNKLALAAGAWLGGVLLGTLAGVDPAVVALLLAAALLAAVALRLGRLPMLPAVLAALLLLGACRADAARMEPLPEALFGQQVFIEGRIAGHPEPSARRVRLELEIVRMSRDTPAAARRQLTEANAGIYAQSGNPRWRWWCIPTAPGAGLMQRRQGARTAAALMRAAGASTSFPMPGRAMRAGPLRRR